MMMTVTSTDFVTPLALVAVTLRSKVPTEGNAEVSTLSVVNAQEEDCGGMATSEGTSVTVTPEGAGPFQAAVRCAVFADAILDCRVISDDSIRQSTKREG